MRKLLIAGMAVAMLAIPASASAAVERCQVTTTVPGTSVTTAKFTVFEPAGTKTEFDHVWTTKYEVNVSADGKTFEGSGHIVSEDQTIDAPLFVTGTFNSDGTISYEAKLADTDSNVRWVLDHGITDSTSPLTGATNDAMTTNVEGQDWVRTHVKVTQPVRTTVVGAPTTTTTEYKNHGEYVSSLGGGKVAAQECVGMPTNSTQGIVSALAKK